MANNSILKLQTNIPVQMTVKYVDFQQSRTQGYSDQIRLKGTVAGFTPTNDQGQPCDAAVYLPLRCEEDLAKLGVISGRQQSGSYSLLLQNPQVQIVRTEDRNRKFTNIELIGHGGAKAQPPTQYAAPQQRNTYPTNQPTSFAQPADKRAEFSSLSLSMDTCIEEATKLWKASPHAQTITVREITNTAICLFSEMAKRNILRTAKPAEAPQQATPPQQAVPQYVPPTQSLPPQQAVPNQPGLFGSNLPSMLATPAYQPEDIPF